MEAAAPPTGTRTSASGPAVPPGRRRSKAEEGAKLARKQQQRQQQRRRGREEKDDRKQQRKKYCFFCKEKTPIDYKDTALLRRFVSDRGKIRARRVSGNCAQHQRDVAVAVKNAREMALMPFSSR